MKDIFSDEDYLLVRLISQAWHAMHKTRSRELAPLGISGRQAAVLILIVAAGDTITAYKISKWMILEPHTISQLLKRMEKSGLIKKTLNPDKRKSFKLQLTEKGLNAYNEAVRFESMHIAMNALSVEERGKLKYLLKLVRDEFLKQMGIRGRLPYPPF